MKTAIYCHRQPSDDMMAIIRKAAEQDTVITNYPLPLPHMRYVFEKKKKTGGTIWEQGEQTHPIALSEFPFNWMLPDAKVAGMIAALARDSDRILLIFPKTTKIEPLWLFLAFSYNKIVRVFKGAVKQDITPQDLKTEQTRKQFDDFILTPLPPLPAPKTLLTTPNGSTVRPYQQQMIDFGLAHASTGWFVDMGLGKTLAALVLIDTWIKRGEIDPKKPIFIVAPIMVALDTWSREAAKWGYDWDIKINVRLTPKKREHLLKELLLPMEKPTLFLTNPAQLEQIRDYYFSFNIPLPFEVLVIDELSQFKSPTSKRSGLIVSYRQKASKFVGLTGTPASNQLLDIWNQLKIIDREHTGWAGNNIYEFQNRYFLPAVTSPEGHVRKWKPKFGAEPIIYRKLADHAVSMRTKGLVNLPEISYSNLFVTLPDDARKEYDALEEAVKEEAGEGSITHVTADGHTIFVPNSEVLSGKLLQIAGGALYTDTQTHAFDVYHEEKLQALDNLMESATSPLLVFYYFESDYKRIEQKYKNRIPRLDSKDRNAKALIEKWNEGEIPVLLAHPASVGHGLNLQDGGHQIVWFSLPNWNNDTYRQANKRLHRSGQTHPVNVTHIVAKDTIEEIMLRSLNSKEKTNDRLMAALDRAERTSYAESSTN